jgi:hypothetical protein
MKPNIIGTANTEWPCRIALTIHFLLITSGYILFFQTSYQLDSPVIPKDTVMLIAKPYLELSLAAAPLFIISLYFYFYRKLQIALIISLGSVIAHIITMRYFIEYL